MKTILHMFEFDSPLGRMQAYVSDTDLHALVVTDQEKAIAKLAQDYKIEQGDNHPVTKAVQQDLAHYFAGHDLVCSGYGLAPQGTDFQKNVWQHMRKITCGNTLAYADIAKAMGREKSFRAVANACGRNPILLYIPCHRVVSKDGLGGFSVGIDRKKHLLALEKSIKSAL